MKNATEKQRDGNLPGQTYPCHQARRFRAALTRGGTLLILLAALTVSTVAALAGDRDNGPRAFKTFTANAYVGADLASAIVLDPTAPDYLSNLLATVTATYVQIVASDPPARMAGLAREIAATGPELVGLEEIETLETAPMTAQGTPGTFSVSYDYLQLITNALAARGAHYTVAAATAEFGMTMPMLDLQTGGLLFARLVDHEVILARTDLPPGHLRLANPQSGHYTNLIQIPAIGFSQTRGWCSVDVFSRGETFRYICTHLEQEVAPQLQVAQAQELLAGVANAGMPVVIVGDFNADPLHRDGSIAYDQFIQAGFKDAWSVVYPRPPADGLTWGHDAALADPSQRFDRRIDLVFYRDAALHPTGVSVLDLRINRAQAPLWPSDHAAVAAQFLLGNDSRAHGRF